MDTTSIDKLTNGQTVANFIKLLNPELEHKKMPWARKETMQWIFHCVMIVSGLKK